MIGTANMTGRAGRAGIDISVDGLVDLRALAGEVDLAAARHGATSASGALPGQRLGRGLEVRDRRPYVRGDDIRHVDWRATARTGLPHVKLFAQERERALVLAVDLRPSMVFGTRRALRSHMAVEVAALIAWQARGEQCRIGGGAISARGTVLEAPRAGERPVLALLGALAGAHEAALAGHVRGNASATEPPLEHFLEQAGRLVPRGGQLVLVSGFEAPGPHFFALLAALAQRIEIWALLIAPPALALPMGIYPWSLAAQAGRAWIARKAEIGAPDHAALATSLAEAGAIVLPLDPAIEPVRALGGTAPATAEVAQAASARSA